MTPHPLDTLDELEARRRHPAGSDLPPPAWCPHTGRALPQHIPAVYRPSWRERAVMGVLWAGMAGATAWVSFAYWSGGAG